MKIHLRSARPEDAAVLKRWDDEPHVLASDPNDDWCWEDALARTHDWGGEQLMAELDGRPIGFIQIIDPAQEESHYWGDCAPHLRAVDIWIGEPDALNQGHGSEMMRQALALCFASPEVTAVIIDPLASNTRALRFYQRFGFVPAGPRSFGLDDCLVMRLERADWMRRI